MIFHIFECRCTSLLIAGGDYFQHVLMDDIIFNSFEHLIKKPRCRNIRSANVAVCDIHPFYGEVIKPPSVKTIQVGTVFTTRHSSGKPVVGVLLCVVITLADGADRHIIGFFLRGVVVYALAHDVVVGHLCFAFTER